MKYHIILAFVAFSIAAFAVDPPSPPLPDPASQDGKTLQLTILAKAPPLTMVERVFALNVQKAIEGVTKDYEVTFAFYQSNAEHYPDKVALAGNDPAAWTPQLIETYALAALSWLGKPDCWHLPVAVPVFEKLKVTGLADRAWKRVFKKLRRSWPMPLQISRTSDEVQFLTAAAERTPEQSLWLAELSLDLTALRIANSNP